MSHSVGDLVIYRYKDSPRSMSFSYWGIVLDTIAPDADGIERARVFWSDGITLSTSADYIGLPPELPEE